MAEPARTRLLASYVPRVARTWLDGEDASDLHRRVEGTVVFVDVSGFTRMSERLARFGRVGAEHVTDIIRSCFGRLLTEAYDFGATLLKFGGDALLLFFWGEDHARRAAAAAFSMRAALRATSTYDTDAGRVELKMTVGVHSGDFDFFLVGGSHRELVLAGPTATAAVAVEESARTGEIVISAATAAALPARHVGAPRGPGFLLRGAPGASRVGGVTFYEAATDVSVLVPVSLRELLVSGDGGSEHRRVTVAFCAYDGFDEVVAGSGAAVAAKYLDELVRIVQETADARGVCFLGSDIAAGGGKIILTAGAPVSCGADEEQMLLALREIVDRRPSLPVRIGVNAGPVFAGEIGTTFRRTYTVMGDAVNLAARVMARAEPGRILATTPVLDASRTLFVTRPLEPFAVKGKRRPVEAAEVGAPRGARNAVASADLPLVGRDGELAAVLAVAPRSPGDHGAFIELVGDPGAGKTRFLQEVERRLELAPAHRVGCRLYQQSTPYFPFRELITELVGLRDLPEPAARDRLRETVGAVAPETAPWFPLLAATMAFDSEETPEVAQLEEQYRRQRLHEAVDALLAALVPGPALLCFEDVHWMDDASSDLVRLLAARARRRSWLLVVTRRNVGSGFVPDEGDHGLHVELEPLGVDAAARLVTAARVDDPLPKHTVEAVVERADGNPLFLLELLAALELNHELAALPDSVEGLLSARIDRLAPPDRTVLRHLAVLGSWFREEYVGAVLPESTDSSSLARLEEFLLWEDGGAVRFRHALVRDVAYSGLPYATRRELHARVAEQILWAADDTTEGLDALLSLHFFEAQRYEEAYKYSRLAADRARELYANVEATTLYRRARAAAQRLGVSRVEEGDLLEALGDVQELAGCYGDARRAFAAARRCTADDPVATARLLLKEAFVAERSGALALAIRGIRRAQRLVETVDSPEAAVLRARLGAWYAAIRAAEGKMRAAASAAREAIQHAGLADDTDALARGLVVLDHAEVTLGVAHDWSRTRQALEIYRDEDDLGGIAMASNNLGAAAYFDGRWAEALTWYGRARDARVRLGDPVGAAMIDANIAEIMVGQGRLDGAEALLSEAMAVQAGAGDAAVAFTTRLLGLVAGRRDDFARAHELLQRARVELERQGAQNELAEAELTAVEILLRERRSAEALELLDRLLADESGRAALEPFAPAVRRLRGVALLQLGDRDAGCGALAEALAVAREEESAYETALLLDLLAEADVDADATITAQWRAEASELFGALGVSRVARCPV